MRQHVSVNCCIFISWSPDNNKKFDFRFLLLLAINNTGHLDFESSFWFDNRCTKLIFHHWTQWPAGATSWRAIWGSIVRPGHMAVMCWFYIIEVRTGILHWPAAQTSCIDPQTMAPSSSTAPMDSDCLQVHADSIKSLQKMCLLEVAVTAFDRLVGGRVPQRVF